MPESTSLVLPGKLRDALGVLWLRLVTVAIFGTCLAALPRLVAMAEGWLYLLTTREMIFEWILHVVAIALFASLVASAITILLFPALLRPVSRDRVVGLTTKAAVTLAVFVDLRVLLASMLAHSGLSGRLTGVIILLYYTTFAVCLLIRRTRMHVAARAEDLVGGRTTRRVVLGFGAATAATIVTEALSRPPAIHLPALPKQRPPSNILLVTFDTLSADDMSLYGYRLNTTPQIDAFAKSSSVFTNFYSASTFTTPSVASLLASRHPSEHGVHHLPGRFRRVDWSSTLPYVLRAGGYATGASISSAYVHFLNQDLAASWDILPDVQFHVRDIRRLWNATEILHQRGAIGNRALEYLNFKHALEFIPEQAESRFAARFARLQSPFPPDASFSHARGVLDRLPQGFFMWVHVMAPHGPYLPNDRFVGRYLSPNEMRTETDQNKVPQSGLYDPSQQSIVSTARLRYDEFLSEADDAFGSFVRGLEQSGRLSNTTVIVSADHGESFEGRVFGHENRYLTRSQIHIPLVIRMPGQTEGRRIEYAADHTALAPTILDIAGLHAPRAMRGKSLAPLLNGRAADQGGAAFTQHLDTDNVFTQPHKGTVGVVSGDTQYVLDLRTGRGILRPVSLAQSWSFDVSDQNLELASQMRGMICSRFPGLPRDSA
jgi:arylsulfatase A-like enzyme